MPVSGWVESGWRATAENRRAKYYELTPEGRRALGDDLTPRPKADDVQALKIRR
jgi:DNA-binding PadR family transcriptional regulator